MSDPPPWGEPGDYPPMWGPFGFDRYCWVPSWSSWELGGSRSGRSTERSKMPGRDPGLPQQPTHIRGSGHFWRLTEKTTTKRAQRNPSIEPRSGSVAPDSSLSRSGPAVLGATERGGGTTSGLLLASDWSGSLVVQSVPRSPISGAPKSPEWVSRRLVNTTGLGRPHRGTYSALADILSTRSLIGTCAVRQEHVVRRTGSRFYGLFLGSGEKYGIRPWRPRAWPRRVSQGVGPPHHPKPP